MSRVFLFLIIGIRLFQCRTHTLIDSDTPEELWSTTSLRDGSTLQLVMSDEFTRDGRSFAKGQDPLFEAVEKPDNSNEAIQFCNDTCS